MNQSKKFTSIFRNLMFALLLGTATFITGCATQSAEQNRKISAANNTQIVTEEFMYLA